MWVWFSRSCRYWRCVSQSLCWSHSPVGHRDHSHHKYSPNLNLSASPGTAPHHISNDIRAHLGLNGSSQAWGEDNNGTRKRRKKHWMSESSLESHSWKWQISLSKFSYGDGSPWFMIHQFCCMYWKIIGGKVLVSWDRLFGEQVTACNFVPEHFLHCWSSH